jgi:hypothetical protein
VFAEGLLIIVSILLAFAVDAWWDERSARNEADEELERVYYEVLADRPRIERSFHSQARSAAGAAEVARILESAGQPTVLVADTLLRGLFQVGTYESRTPALDGLLRSGRISLIEDIDVRAAIAAWERALQNASELQLRARRFSDEHVLPVLSRRGAVGHVIRSEASTISFRSETLERTLDDVVADPGGFTEVVADEELAAAVSIRFSSTARASSAFGEFLQATELLLQVVGEARGR